MPRYSWVMPTGRLIFGALIAFSVVWIPHDPERFDSVIGCDGTSHEGFLVFSQLVVAALIIEGLNWVVWYFTVGRKATPAQLNFTDTEYYTQTRGQFLGPNESLANVVFTFALSLIMARFVGIPDPCTPSELSKPLPRTFVGGLLMMYGILLMMNYLWERYSNRHVKTST
jgi:hypothetical protein